MTFSIKENVRIYTAVLLVLYGICFLVWIATQKPTVESLGGDHVTPAVVKVGGTISISRNVKYNSTDEVRITRSMVKGDCAVNCVTVDLPSSTISRRPGIYMNSVRDHVLPISVTPGHWKLEFTAYWLDRFGRSVPAPFEVLEIEVIP